MIQKFVFLVTPKIPHCKANTISKLLMNTTSELDKGAHLPPCDSGQAPGAGSGLRHAGQAGGSLRESGLPVPSAPHACVFGPRKFIAYSLKQSRAFNKGPYNYSWLVLCNPAKTVLSLIYGSSVSLEVALDIAGKSRLRRFNCVPKVITK